MARGWVAVLEECSHPAAPFCDDCLLAVGAPLCSGCRVLWWYILQGDGSCSTPYRIQPHIESLTDSVMCSLTFLSS